MENVLDIIKAFAILMIIVHALKMAYDIGYNDAETDKARKKKIKRDKRVEAKTEKS